MIEYRFFGWLAEWMAGWLVGSLVSSELANLGPQFVVLAASSFVFCESVHISAMVLFIVAAG